MSGYYVRGKLCRCENEQNQNYLPGVILNNRNIKGVTIIQQNVIPKSNHQDAEFAVGPFTITAQRETISDMSVPLSGANKEMMMQRPTLKTDVSGFLRAFTAEVRPTDICGRIVSSQRSNQHNPSI